MLLPLTETRCVFAESPQHSFSFLCFDLDSMHLVTQDTSIVM